MTPATWMSVLVLIKQAFKIYIIELQEYGIIRTILLNTILPQAKTVIVRVRTHVLGSHMQAEEALIIRDSYKDSFNMVAVAAAILAQIAVTALSLSHIEEVHWTATAAFVASLIYSLFAVYFSCVLQLKLGGLHRGKDVLTWLVDQDASPRFVLFDVLRVADTEGGDDKDIPITKVASFYAVLMLVAPSQLLNWSLCTLIIGIGIYYGQIYSIGIGMLPGQNANLAVLIVYIITTVGSATEYFLPFLGKTLENYNSRPTQKEITISKRVRKRGVLNTTSAVVDGVVSNARATAIDEGNKKHLGISLIAPNADQDSPNSTEALIKAIQESVRLQEANLRVMQDLLKTIVKSQQLDTRS